MVVLLCSARCRFHTSSITSPIVSGRDIPVHTVCRAQTQKLLSDALQHYLSHRVAYKFISCEKTERAFQKCDSDSDKRINLADSASPAKHLQLQDKTGGVSRDLASSTSDLIQ